MSTALPDPLVPAEVDLRGLEYMPLFGNHLFGSEFNAAATDSEWRAAMTLWWAAWNQVPAGSLPNDDVALCRLADLGRDVKGWRKLKARALHGFEQCSDDRLYHAFLCEQAIVAWDKRVKERQRKAKWRADQDAKRAGQDGDKSPPSPPQERGRDADVPAEGKGRDGTGRDGTGRDDVRARDPGPGGPGAPPVPADVIFGRGVPLLTAANVTDRNARSMLGLMRKTHGDDAVIGAIQRCAEERPLDPVSWLQAALKAKPKATREEATREFNDTENAKAKQLLGIGEPHA